MTLYKDDHKEHKKEKQEESFVQKTSQGKSSELELAKKEMLDIKNIDLALDSYDDLFSDFDISSYSKRMLSEDFLMELIKRAPTEKSGPVQVILSIPTSKRVISTERIIQRRIRHYFSQKIQEINYELKAYQHNGIKYIVIGLVLTIAALLIPDEPSLARAVANVLEVVSWFSVWNGLSKIFDEPSHLIKTRKVYSILSSARYLFVNEEDIDKATPEKLDVI